MFRDSTTLCLVAAAATVAPQLVVASSMDSCRLEARRLDSTLLSARLRNSAPDPDRTAASGSDSDMSMNSGPQSPVADTGKDVILDVECGLNKAVLYLNRLSSGSKGACVLFDNAWLTPNEFQYVSGRETAKDWKRSIKHYGKSLKLLIAKGFMTTEPASCRCEGCVVTDDKSDHVDDNMAPEANQENVPPGDQIQNEIRNEIRDESEMRTPDVEAADKGGKRAEANDGRVTGNAGSDDKISSELCERPVLQSLVDDVMADGKMEASKKVVAKKRKSLSKSAEKAKKLRKRSHDVRDEMVEQEVSADDANSDADRSGVADCPDGHETPDEMGDNWSPEANMDDNDGWEQRSPGGATNRASPAQRQVAPEVDEVGAERGPGLGHVIDGETKSVDDVKGQNHLAADADVIEAEVIRSGSAAVSTTTRETSVSPSARHVYRSPVADVTSLEAVGQTFAVTLDDGAMESRGGQEASPRHSGATTDDDDDDGDEDDDDDGDDEDEDDDVEDLCDSEPEARPSSAPQLQSSDLVVNIADDVSEPGDSLPLSPRKEARLTCIIAELKSYKKQLIQRIEEQKVTGDLTDGEEGKDQIIGADEVEVTSADSDQAVVGGDKKSVIINGDKVDTKEFESPEKCKTLYHILSSGSVPDESKPVATTTTTTTSSSSSSSSSNNNNSEVSSTTTSCNNTVSCSRASSSAPITSSSTSSTSCSVNSSCPAASVHSTPEAQPLKSSFQKESRQEIRKTKNKPAVSSCTHSDSRDVKKETPQKSAAEKKSSCVSTSSSSSSSSSAAAAAAARIMHGLDSGSAATLSTPLTPIPNSMYLAPPLFPFPYGIPPGYLYPSGLYGGFPFPDPTAIYKSLAASQALPIATSATTGCYDFSIPVQSPFKPPTLSGKHSPVMTGSAKKDSKSGSKMSRRDKQPSSKSKSPLPSSGSAIQLFPPESAAGHYMTMYPQFGFPDMSYLTSSAAKSSQINGHLAKIAKSQNASPPEGGSLKSSRNSTCRSSSAKSSHAEGGGDILDLSVRKRSAGGVGVLDHYAAAKIPCYGSPFPHRNGLVLDLSKSSAR